MGRYKSATALGPDAREPDDRTYHTGGAVADWQPEGAVRLRALSTTTDTTPMLAGAGAAGGPPLGPGPKSDQFGG